MYRQSQITHASPEEDLWVAVLETAIRDAASTPPPGDPRATLEKRWAQAWLRAQRDDYIGGCGWVCDALGIERGWPLRLVEALAPVEVAA